MNANRPDPANLPASREWVRQQFAVASRYRAALRQVDRSLAAIDEYQLSFSLSRAGLLACLERWPELVNLLRELVVRYPAEIEVWDDVADLFMAHGDYGAALAVHRRARPLITCHPRQNELELYYWSYLECLYAVGKRREALAEGRRLLRRHPRFGLIRAELKNIEARTLRIDPWAPTSAPYLRELKRLAT